MIPVLLTGPDPEQLLNQALQDWLPTDQQPLLLQHPDFYLLPETPDANSIGISQIRQLIKNLQLKPMQSPTKLVIIHHAHLLTIEAQNALLKTLEDPPSYVQIVLITPQPQTLLSTILSRIIVKRIQNQKKTPVAGQSPAKEISHDLSPITINYNLLLRTPPALRLIQTPALAKDRNTARQLILELTHYFHQQLISSSLNHDRVGETPLNDPHKKPTLDSPLLSVLKLLTKSLNYLDANTHPQLTIDHLLLHLPQI